MALFQVTQWTVSHGIQASRIRTDPVTLPGRLQYRGSSAATTWASAARVVPDGKNQSPALEGASQKIGRRRFGVVQLDQTPCQTGFSSEGRSESR
jgi:hypothetical protein